MSPGDALPGKVAPITWASRGIGFAIARRLGRMGARVAICGRDEAKLDQAASSLRAGRIETLAVPAVVARASRNSQRPARHFRFSPWPSVLLCVLCVEGLNLDGRTP